MKLFSQIEVRPAIKAGIAASLSLWLATSLAKTLERPDTLLSGTWSVLSTFIVLQSHLGGTYRAAGVRFIGVFIGSLMGGFFTWLLGSNLATLSTSVFFTVIFCSFINLKESIRISCMSVSVVMILWGLHPSISPWQFGLSRLTDSTVGILTALVISRTLWPAQAVNTLRKNLVKILFLEGKLFRQLTSYAPLPKSYSTILKRITEELNSLLNDNRVSLQESRFELITETGNLDAWNALDERLLAISDHIIQLKIFHKNDIPKILDKRLQEHLEKTLLQMGDAFTNLKKTAELWEEIDQKIYIEEIIVNLNDELTRFRTTRATRRYERRDVEQFFLFFYHLKSLLEQLKHFEEELISAISQK